MSETALVIVGPLTRAATGALFGLCASACGSSTDLDPAAPQGVVAQVSPSAGSVVTVSWTTGPASIGYVEYGTTPDMPYSTPLQPEQQAHSVMLLGLLPNTSYYYRVVTWAGNDAGASSKLTLQTGPLPAEPPSLSVTGTGHDRFTVVPLVGEALVVIIDPQGGVVWSHPDASGLPVQRARLSLDGQGVVYNRVGEAGALVRVPFDRSSESVVPVPLLGSDFVEHTDGTLAALASDTRDFQGTPLRGDKIVEVGPDQVPTDVWSVWDCFDPAQVPGDDMAEGWGFANALDYIESEQAYYVGLRNFSSIVKVNRSTGVCEWVLGSSGATIPFAEGAEPFLHQGQFQLAGPSMLVLDQEGGPGGTSRVIEYALGATQEMATQVSSYPATPSFILTAPGEPTRIPGGETFINWSSQGLLERVDSTGQQLWSLTASGSVFGYHDMTGIPPASLYTETSRMPSRASTP